MLMCTVYIFIGMALTTTIIELVSNPGYYNTAAVMLAPGEAAVRGELAADGGAQGADPGPAQAGSHPQEAGRARRCHNLTQRSCSSSSFTESHNLDIELDLAGDLALLRKNLAKMRKGKMGKGLHDVLIEEFEWVINMIYNYLKYHILILCSKQLFKAFV